MLIWINGTFGVGKTQTAFELHERLPGSTVVDPEQIGYAMRRISPRSIWPEDFQSLPQWRDAVAAHLRWVIGKFDGVVIVPMTLLEPEWHEKIIGDIRLAGIPMRHFTLVASEQTVRERLIGRGDASNDWAITRLQRYLTTMNLPQFAQQIDTERRGISEVATEIAQAAALPILAPRHPLVASGRRFAVWLRHLRLLG
jgi:hypothetical protein